MVVVPPEDDEQPLRIDDPATAPAPTSPAIPRNRRRLTPTVRPGSLRSGLLD